MKTFEQLDLIPSVQRALTEEKYETPTPIQAKTIPSALKGRDVLGCAQTGTGKTAAFALPILNQLGERNRKAPPNHPFVLVLAPTRELAVQIGDSFATYGRHLRLRQVLVYGGVSASNQIRALKRGAHVLIATPGRLLDLMNQGHIHLDQLDVFVLDEADRMLDMGFLPDLKRIIAKLPRKRQSLFFLATMAPKIVKLSQSLLKNPATVNVTPKTTSVEKIEQRVLFVERGGKQSLLKNILKAPGVERALVFTKTKRGANALSQKLVKSGVKATAIHGNKSQNARQRALEAFRSKNVQVLVATDVAARGIDIDGITHVVNFDLPIEPENYVHRIGRTGRAGSDGVALSFCCPAERGELRAIERLIGQKVPVANSNTQPELKRSASSDSQPAAAPKQRGPKPPRPKRVATKRTKATATTTATTTVSSDSTQSANSRAIDAALKEKEEVKQQRRRKRWYPKKRVKSSK